MNVAIIPARGNSKGILGKNYKLLGGKPLILWTINAAKESGVFDYIVVTSESELLLELARASSVMAIVRPEYLSMDTVQTNESCLDALRQLQLANINPDIVTILQPTSPFRTAEDIRSAIERFNWGNGGENWLDYTGTVVSVYKSTKYHWHAEEWDVTPLYHNPQKRLGRQWEEDMGMYTENGAVYVCSAERFGREGGYRLPPYRLFVMPENRSLDLDSVEDWAQAEYMLEKGLV